VLLNKALEEQELQLSGITEENNAARLGQIFGLDAFIVGSIMKVGKNITISGRAINTQTGEIIATGSVKFTNLERLDKHLEELAYQLSGFSIREYRKIKFEQEISKNRFGARIGVGYSLDIDNSLGSFLPLSAGPFYEGRYLDAGICSLSNLSEVTSISAIINFFPFFHFGFGVGWVWGNYSMREEEYRDVLGKEWYAYDYYALVFGIVYRVTQRLRISFHQGPAFTGVLHYQDKDNNEGSYKVKSVFFMTQGATMIGNVEYLFTENLSANFILHWNNAQADTEDFIRSQNIIFGLQIGYSFSF